jgi:NitT/TauT family transport system substrate-binding protein
MIKAVMAGAPLVSVGVLQKKSLFSVMGFADKNIRTPKDLIGKRIMMTPGDGVSQAFAPFLKINGIRPDQIDVIAGDVQAKRVTLMTGNSDLVGGNLNDQGPSIEDITGKPVRAIVFSDWGVHQIASGIEVNKAMVLKNPDLIRRFMRATTKAYLATRASPEAAADAMLKVAPLAGKREIIVKSIKLGLPYHDIVEGKNPFYVSPQRVQETVKFLVDYAGLDPEALKRTNSFVDLSFIQ